MAQAAAQFDQHRQGESRGEHPGASAVTGECIVGAGLGRGGAFWHGPALKGRQGAWQTPACAVIDNSGARRRRMPYDPRYLAGVQLFNAGDFFEAHEVWEDLWSYSHGEERKFYQGLIQAAVGLCHFHNGNLGGAVKLYRSSRDYMRDCGERFLGLDVADFWRRMEACYAPLLGPSPADRATRPQPELLPEIRLDPAPDSWPDPEEYLPHEDE